MTQQQASPVEIETVWTTLAVVARRSGRSFIYDVREYGRWDRGGSERYVLATYGRYITRAHLKAARCTA